MSLFQRGKFNLASGLESAFKIDCDFLTDEDIETLAWLINGNLWKDFGKVEGVPQGGLRLAAAMEQYAKPNRTDKLLVVDDVYTTGGSMNKHRAGRDAIGAVIFARRPVDDLWVFPLFRLGV